MDSTVFILGLLYISSICMATGEANQPLVAFMCNKPAMYLSDGVWVEDRTTDCIQEPRDILEYCRKVYPTKEITNVVETSELVTINNWCGFDASKCHQHNQHTVRPFRCLVGPFQSDALLVPEHCVFDHKHGTQCARYMEWNRTASESCQSHNMRLDSFAMLQPCTSDVNVFNGVEFVCCPPSKTEGDKAFIVEDDSNLLADNDADFWKPAPVKDSNDIRADPNSIRVDSNSILPIAHDIIPQPVETQRPDYIEIKAKEGKAYENYIIGERGPEYYNEHEFFLKAKADMQKHHHERVAVMMKDWAEARQRVADMKANDPKGAESLEKEMTERFQKTYEALEVEGMEEKKQIDAIHQLHVDRDLNNKKREAMEHYMDVLSDPKPDPNLVFKALRHYVKTEEKDRLRTLNHYRHVQESVADGPDAIPEVESVRQQALDHMDIINQRIQQAIDMLSRIPDAQQNIRTQIAEYMESFQDLDTAIASSLLTLPQQKAVEPEVIFPAQPISEQARTYEELERVEKVDDVKVIEPVKDDISDLHRVSLERTEGNGFGISTFDDEVWEDESKLPEVQQKMAPKANNIRNDKVSVKMSEPFAQKQSFAQTKDLNGVYSTSTTAKQSFAQTKDLNGVYSTSTTAGIAVAAVAVFIMLVVGGVLLRRNSTSARRARNGFIAVDTNASPEERHVASMQMNGYENPTYKYFELGSGSQA